MHERACDCNALLCAAGELSRQRPGAGREANAVQDGLHPAPSLRLLHADQLERQFNVLRRGQRRQEMEELKNRADARAADARQGIGRQPVHILALQDDRASIRAIDAAQAVEQGGLPTPGWAGERHSFAPRHVEGDFIEHPPCTVALDDLPDGEHGGRG